MLTLSIDNKEYEFYDGESILKVAKRNGIDIYTLCYLEECDHLDNCGVCLVELAESGELVRACSTKAVQAMKVLTNSKKVTLAVKERVSDILNHHNFNCGECKRRGICELLELIQKTRAKKTEHLQKTEVDTRSKSIVYDKSKCVECNRCIATCTEKSGTKAIRFDNLNLSFDDTDCLLCGQCVTTCPVDALYEKSHIERVKEALADNKKHVIVAMAPSVRTALGEDFLLGFGTDVTGKVYSALREIGFKKVFDINFSADMTIMEEGTELIKRIEAGGPFPMFTSCCPGWIRLVENYYPELIPNVSTAKSPQQMFGAAAKSYYPFVENIEPKDVFMVSVMPCTAKKFEADRDEMYNNGIKNIDAVLTTRELGRFIKEMNIDFDKLEESEVDEVMGQYTGAGTIFGATGGVMEAALRTTKDLVEGISLSDVDYVEVRGLDGIKEATVKIAGNDYNIAVINGAGNFFKFKNEGHIDKKQYHFIEVMACPGGCVNGGGQPFVSSKTREEVNFRKERATVLYNQDKTGHYRKSHKNPALLAMYEKFMGEPGGEKAEELLHVVYKPKK